MAKILIVDDDVDVAELLSSLLEARGHEVRRAADGHEGLRLLEEELPDLLILDVEMPQLTGPDVVYRMIVHDAGMEDIPVLLVSGVVGLSSVAERVGTPYFVGKPFPNPGPRDAPPPCVAGTGSAFSTAIARALSSSSRGRYRRSFGGPSSLGVVLTSSGAARSSSSGAGRPNPNPWR